jgi:hypothetical protein
MSVELTGEKRYVSESFRVAAGSATTNQRVLALVRVLQVINRVHPDGHLKNRGLIRWVANLKDVEGKDCDGMCSDDDPPEIEIWEQAQLPQWTLVHEIGHVLYRVICQVAVSQQARQALEAWQTAVEESRAVRAQRQLQALEFAPVAAPSDGAQTEAVSPEYLEYLLRPTEQYARSYSQYIAMRSGDNELNEQLAAQVPLANRIDYHEQWDEDDFREIAVAMDRLFGFLEWSH